MAGLPGAGAGGRGREGDCGEFQEGGGLNIFFRGRNSHQESPGEFDFRGGTNSVFGKPCLCQEPIKGGFSKGGFCRVPCHARRNTRNPRLLGPAVHLALRAPQPRETYIFAKTPF